MYCIVLCDTSHHFAFKHRIFVPTIVYRRSHSTTTMDLTQTFRTRTSHREHSIMRRTMVGVLADHCALSKHQTLARPFTILWKPWACTIIAPGWALCVRCSTTFWPKICSP
eukprot:COSAG02_NODE_981_length_15488_cov_27.585093_13_plen_111_part_00